MKEILRREHPQSCTKPQKFLGGFFIAILASVVAYGNISVTSVKARQRYPWNGKVDIDCRVSGGVEGKPYTLTVTAHDKVGGTNLTVRSVSLEGGPVAESNPVTIEAGQAKEREYRLVWDAGKDLPQGFKSGRVSVSVSVAEAAKKYLVIELESGAVTYMSEPPDGGFDTDEYKTTKMVFVRIEPQSYMQMESELFGRKVTITKPFYVAVHDLTLGQVSAIGQLVWRYNSGWGWKTNGDELIFNAQHYINLLGLDKSWPLSDNPQSDTAWIKAIRDRTGLRINLPTIGMMCLAQKILGIENSFYGCVDKVYNFEYGTFNWRDSLKIVDNQPVIDPLGIRGDAQHDNWPIDDSHAVERIIVRYLGGKIFEYKSTYFEVYTAIRLCIHDASDL